MSCAAVCAKCQPNDVTEDGSGSLVYNRSVVVDAVFIRHAYVLEIDVPWRTFPNHLSPPPHAADWNAQPPLQICTACLLGACVSLLRSR
jgi:hypothetical protein